MDKNNDDDGKTDGIRVAAAFLTGAMLSAAAGWLGMEVYSPKVANMGNW